MKHDKINNVAVDYQPDAMEIAMRPLPLPARLGVTLGLVFFLSALIASYFCKVDVIVECPGKLVSVEPNIVMKPLDRTVVKSINVKVGELVKKDQVLFTFDPAINMAEEARLRSELSSYKAQYDRWNLEFHGKRYVPDDPSNEDQVWQADISKKRFNYYEKKIRYFDEAEKRITASIHTTRENIRQQQMRLTSLKEISKMYKELHQQRAVSKKNVLEMQMEELQLEAEITKLTNSILEEQHELESSKASKETFMIEWTKDIAEAMVQAQRNVVTTEKSLEKVLKLSAYVILRSPCDAIVHEVASFPVGSAVREAEALITLVPIHCPIELEAEIPTKDIGKVKVGDQVRVKLNAFPFQKHGTLNGVVRNISEDTFQREAHSELDNSTYYRGRIVLSGKLRNIHKNFRLIPGMEVQAEIKVGTRSVLEYVIYPLIKSLDEAIREP